MCCNHEYIEKEMRVRPAGHISFRMKYSECVHCKFVMATDKQRKKNRKQANYARNKYSRIA